MISVDEYRKILNDRVSSDEQIVKRLKFLEALCRNLIKGEIEIYVKEQKAKTK